MERETSDSINPKQTSIKDRKLQINFVEGPANLNLPKEHTLFLQQLEEKYDKSCYSVSSITVETHIN